jgi:hypothetical protein
MHLGQMHLQVPTLHLVPHTIKCHQVPCTAIYSLCYRVP